MVDTKYFLFECNNPSESAVAIVEIDKRYASDIAERIELAKRISESLPTLSGIEFYADVDAYESSIEELLPDDIDSLIEQWDVLRWVCTDKKPSTSELIELRLGFSELNIGRDGSFYWELFPKYSQFSYETRALGIHDLKNEGLL